MLRFNLIKNISSVLLTVLLIYNSFGYIFVYFPASLLIKHFVNKSIKEKNIDVKELSMLAFNISDLKKNKYDFIWKKTGKEFRFNGKMYDIEEEMVNHDTVYYTVYYDHKENILEELFSLQLKDNKKEKAQNSVQRVVLAGLYYEQIRHNRFEINLLNLSNLPLNKSETSITNYISDIPTPPPRLIV